MVRVESNHDDEIQLFKLKLFQETDVVPGRMRLFYGQRELLGETSTLHQLGVDRDATLFLVDRLAAAKRKSGGTGTRGRKRRVGGAGARGRRGVTGVDDSDHADRSEER